MDASTYLARLGLVLSRVPFLSLLGRVRDRPSRLAKGLGRGSRRRHLELWLFGGLVNSLVGRQRLDLLLIEILKWVSHLVVRKFEKSKPQANRFWNCGSILARATMRRTDHLLR